MVIANRIAAALRSPMAHQLRATPPALIRALASPTLPEIIGVALDPETPCRRRRGDVFPAMVLGEFDRALAIGEAQPIERGERVACGSPLHQRLHFLAVPRLEFENPFRLALRQSRLHCRW